MKLEKDYSVCAGWNGDRRIGTLYVMEQRGKEIQSFAYDPAWLEQYSHVCLDPDILPYPGRQYAPDNTFRFLGDASPDRWGRKLMNRREAISARLEARPARQLTDTDYLIGVSDLGRTGGIRISDGTAYLAADSLDIPPMAQLRMLQDAASNFENSGDPLEERWLNQLIYPGSSLGGARPKANVMDENKELWIAKFPSQNDELHAENWEQFTNELAKACGLRVPETRLHTFSGKSTFLSKRFDRNQNHRIHFASAMTMLQKNDGDNASFLDIASFISANGANPEADLYELWKRIAFSVAVSNTDCHLRNHGFLLDDTGWHLSPLYDVNPAPYGQTMAIAITKDDNTKRFDLVAETAPYYGVANPQAEIDSIKTIIREQYSQLADKCLISKNEQRLMKPAFGL